ncbi:MAG: amidohydrolase family protein [Thermoanaerobaculia bacterium]
MRLTHARAWALALTAFAAAGAAHAGGPDVHALTEVKIVVGPGQTIEKGTVVIRDGVIEAVGADVAPPADARVWEKEELTVYPGLIDAYVERSWPAKKDDDDGGEGAHENSLVRPERAMSRFGADEGKAKKLREAGVTTAVVTPEEGLFRGSSVVVNLGEGGPNDNILRADHAQNVTFATTGGFGNGYPGSLMGSVALFRQTLLDARWHEKAWAAYNAKPSQKRPAMNAALAALSDVANGRELVVIEGDDAGDALRSAAMIEEFGLEAHLVGSGDEYQWLDEIAAIGAPVILPINLPDLPDPPDEDDMVLSLDDLRHWDRAPGNAKELLDAGVTVAFTTHGLDDPKKVLSNLWQATDRGGLSADEALAAFTTTPAGLLGISDRAGTITAGKMANLVIVEGDLFAEKPAVREVWVDGHRFEIKESKPAEVEPAGTWNLTVTTGDGQTLPAVMILTGEADSLEGTISDPEGNQVPISSATVSGTKLEIVFDGTPYGMPGDIEFDLNIEGDSGSGDGMSPAGPFTIKGTREAPEVTR